MQVKQLIKEFNNGTPTPLYAEVKSPWSVYLDSKVKAWHQDAQSLDVKYLIDAFKVYSSVAYDEKLSVPSTSILDFVEYFKQEAIDQEDEYFYQEMREEYKNEVHGYSESDSDYYSDY